MNVTTEFFGSIEGHGISLFKLSDGEISISVMNYGATVVSVFTPDTRGETVNIVAGFPDLQGYLGRHPYFGSVIGRFANRIRGGTFVLNGKRYQLTQNDGVNHLHGGFYGFDRKVWEVDYLSSDGDGCSISFSCTSEDEEEGYPGNLSVRVTYTLNRMRELIIEYYAETDHPTPLNLTCHPYFNLTGFERDTIYDHELQLFSDWHTEKDSNDVPTGKLLLNAHTPCDFSTRRRIGGNMEGLSGENGYNHNFVIRSLPDLMTRVAQLYEPGSGRMVTVLSDRPGLQVYTANEWNGSIIGAQGRTYGRHSAVALETQFYPDSPNHPDFPDSIVTPRKPFYSRTVYRFGIGIEE